MATGFNYTTSEDVGSVRIAHAAGSLIAALDFALTTGSSPWTKTVNGTNDVTYQAPGGSQIKFRVYDNVTSSTTLIRRLSAQVGAGLVFPTAEQEANSSLGYLIYRVRSTTSSSSANDARWVCVRTDRFFLFSSTHHGTSTVVYMMCAGDFPTVIPDDPGFCAAISATSNSITSAASTYSTNAGFTSSFDSLTTSVAEEGYAEFAINGSTTPVPCGVAQTGPCGYINSYSGHLGNLILNKVTLYSSSLALGTNKYSQFRGTLPFLRTIANDPAGLVHMDTFSVGAATYLYLAYDANTPLAIMISNHEDGLP